MQIYEEKSAEFVDFASDLLCFGENRTKKDEKNDYCF